jgi:nucleotide-binding universal stress UspA family protein
MSRIVVGVDGSASSKAALRWAITQAELTGASVEAITGWHYPVTVGSAWAPVAGLADTDFEQIAVRLLSQAVAEVTDPASKVDVSTTVRQGNAAQVLLDASKDADLLVVGSRGHGGFAEALLGSVSQHCVHHATCPVVIIRGVEGG